MMPHTQTPPRRNAGGSSSSSGNLNSLSKATWWEMKSKVMAAAKEVLMGFLNPKHHDQWEYAAHKCFQLGNKKMSKHGKTDDFSGDDDSKHAEVLRRVARLYVTSKQDGVPRDQLLAICSVVNTTVSMDDWNELLKEVQREMAIEKQNEAVSMNSISNSPTSSSAVAELQSGDEVQVATSHSLLLPPPPALSDHQQIPDKLVQEETRQPIRVSWRGWQLAKEDSVHLNASTSRLQDREYERRCKSYDSNKAISTAIRLISEENSNKENGENSTLSTTHDPMAVVIQNRLGYQSAQLFAEKLDIMQKIIKTYREAENTDEKDFLLGLISGSFTRHEVNKIVVPPEAQVLLPGRVRNTAQISGHKWTSIRKDAGCPNIPAKLEPEKYAEAVKKRKRTIEERRLLANSTFPSHQSDVVPLVTHATGI